MERKESDAVALGGTRRTPVQRFGLQFVGTPGHPSQRDCVSLKRSRPPDEGEVFLRRLSSIVPRQLGNEQ
jgi:hypothetical protein